MKKILLCIVLFLFCIGMRLQATDDIFLIWNQETLNLIASNRAAPTVAARAIAIVQTGVFNAWAVYDENAIGTERGTTLKAPESQRTLANKEEAISFAAYRILRDLFPNASSTASLNALMVSLGYNPLDTSENTTTPVGVGNVSAIDILNFRHNDGSNQLGNVPGSNGLPYSDYTGFVPVNTPFTIIDPNHWQPLLVGGVPQVYVTPQWGLVVPFALTVPNEFPPPCLPALYPDKKYKQQAQHMLKVSAKLDNRTKSIALYWADITGTVTPPGHWCEIAQFVSQRDHLTLDDNVKLFFALGNALLDASIAVWFLKSEFTSERPVTAIHFLFDNKEVRAWGGPCQGTQTILGQNWQSYIPTPPFPSFMSGHSTFSAASAEVLRLFTGSDAYNNSAVVPKGSSFVEPGCAPTKDVVLKWRTFTQAADQAGISRIYGGIHFPCDNRAGKKIGKEVGANAFAKAAYYINAPQSSSPLYN